MKHILIWALLALTTPAAAQDAGPASFDVLFASGDFAGLEAHFAAVHAAHIAGAAKASDLRTPFARFSGSASHIEPMVEQWLAAQPASPYAHAAAAWVYYGKAWRLRGENTYRYTWPAAAQGFQDNIALSQSHAWTAFDASPDLVPASDALLVNEMVLGQLGRFGVYQLTEAVMKITPNRGTIYRASTAFRPNWGGDISNVERLCDDNAGRVTSVDNYTAEACIADMVLWNNVGGEMAQAASDVLSARDWIGFEHHQRAIYSGTIRGPAPDMTEEDVAAYLLQDDVYDYAMAQRFYTNQFRRYPAPQVNQQAEAAQIIERNIAVATAALADDPGNPNHLDMVFFSLEAPIDRGVYEGQEGAARARGEVLRAAPFNPSHWIAAGAALNRPTAYDFRSGGFDAWGNAIAYSNHKPAIIRQVLRNLMPALSLPLRPREDAPEQAAFDAAITCPAVRLARVLDAVCRQSSCGGRRDLDGFVLALLDDAQSRGICEIERNAPIGDIAFYPTEVTVGDHTHRPD